MLNMYLTIAEGGDTEMPAIVRAFIFRHVQHVRYPSTKSELVAACNKMADMRKVESEWFDQNLPNGTYSSADEVIRALNL
jgi:hypothetical protein